MSESGIIRLSSGRIEAPVKWIDLTLPPGFMSYVLRYTGFLCMNATGKPGGAILKPDGTLGAPLIGDEIALALSVDGGLTFIADAKNNDSYIANGINVGNGIANVANSYFPTGLMVLGTDTNEVSDFGMSGEVQLFPGDPSFWFHAMTYHGSVQHDGVHGFDTQWVGLNPAAKVPPPPKTSRVTTIRLLPAGNNDANPPSSGETLASGSYILWGICL
jgi:hypothetical protein